MFAPASRDWNSPGLRLHPLGDWARPRASPEPGSLALALG